MNFEDLSPQDKQAILQRIEYGRKEAPKMMKEGRYADAFDLIYYNALIDPESFHYALRIAQQVEGVHLLRPEQIEVLRQHAEEKRPLAQYLYAYWLYFNRKNMKETDTVIEMLEAASKWGIGDASYLLSVIYRYGEGVVVDQELYRHYEKLASEQHSEKMFFKSIKDHIYGRNGKKEEPDFTITVLRDIIGLPKDTDLRWQAERVAELETEAAQNAHPRLWHLLYLCYDALNIRWAGEIYAQMAIKQGDLGDGYDDLIWCRCVDAKDQEGHFLPEKRDEMLRIAREGAEANSSSMMYRYALLMIEEWENEDTPQERREELEPLIRQWLDRASSLGNYDATYQISNAHLNGLFGYEQDYDQVWYKNYRAAMQGSLFGFYMLSRMAAIAQDEDVPEEEREFLLKPDMDNLPASQWEHLGRLMYKANDEVWPDEE